MDTAERVELIQDWESIREGYFLGEHDETLLDCVGELHQALSAEPRDPDATAFYAFGLVLMYGHAAWEAEPEAAERTVTALRAVASDPAAVGNAPCGHGTHPCDDEDLDGHLSSFEMLLSLLAGDTEDYVWEDLDGEGAGEGEESEPGARWRCPRNVAGFARWAAEAVAERGE